MDVCLRDPALLTATSRGSSRPSGPLLPAEQLGRRDCEEPLIDGASPVPDHPCRALRGTQWRALRRCPFAARASGLMCSKPVAPRPQRRRALSRLSLPYISCASSHSFPLLVPPF